VNQDHDHLEEDSFMDVDDGKSGFETADGTLA